MSALRAAPRRCASPACSRPPAVTGVLRPLRAARSPRVFPLRVRFVSVYSRSDGIVDWRACLDPAAEHVEVASSHCGMSVNSAAFELVTEAMRPRLRSGRFAPAAAQANVAA